MARAGSVAIPAPRTCGTVAIPAPRTCGSAEFLNKLSGLQEGFGIREKHAARFPDIQLCVLKTRAGL